MKAAFFIGLFFVAVACQDESGEGGILREENGLTGKWLYTEYGYSPGAGYFTEKVPSVPAQFANFNTNLSFSTNIEGIRQFKFYRLLQDPRTEEPVLALFEEDPGDSALDINDLTPTYSVAFEENILKLYYRWCIEGCHLGFKKVNNPGEK